ncbi:MAG: TerB family tellurite resistance protein [Desulfuromonadales bacterium]|nr:TerB family tellurite resistance protein [Desulfuromonadales bacterium]
MIGKILSLLQNERPASAGESFTRVQVATCALLLEVAHSDGQYQAVEERIVHDLLGGMFSLPADTIAELVDFARDHQRGSTDLYQFAREINAHFSTEEKLTIMEGVWRLIYADGTLDKFEDAIARQLATLLRLSHKEAIACKVRVLDEKR